MSIDHKEATRVANGDLSMRAGLKVDLLSSAYLDLRAQLEQERDIRSDLEVVLSLVADGLKVSHEPHQTFTERLLEASCKHGDQSDSAE